MIVVAAIAILYEAIRKWIAGLQLEHLGAGALLVLAAAILNAGLGYYLLRTGRRTNSLILEADGKHVLTDSWTSFGVALGLGLVLLTHWKPFDPLVASLGPSLTLTDEIYQIRDFDAAGSHVLLRLDPASVDLTAENVHRHPYGWPLAWTRSYGAGRVFYSALGHEEGVWRDTRFQTLLHNAVLWAMSAAH